MDQTRLLIKLNNLRRLDVFAAITGAPQRMAFTVQANQNLHAMRKNK